MIENNGMAILAHNPGGVEWVVFGIIVLALLGSIWAIGIVGFLLSFSRTRRKTAPVLAHITIVALVLIVLYLLGAHNWNPWTLILNIYDSYIFAGVVALYLAVPGTLAVWTIYRCRKNRPSGNIPPTADRRGE